MSDDALQVLGARIVGILGEDAARELLEVLSRPAEDRARLIARLAQRERGLNVSEMLIDLEVDEVARLQIAEALRRATASS